MYNVYMDKYCAQITSRPLVLSLNFEFLNLLLADVHDLSFTHS